MRVSQVREYQKHNQRLSVMTIAISGAPFLGLLGTVIGVMITFAIVAATGDVNVNTIAPGIAGMLSTPVVGLCVAMPNLFAYNYLAGRIRDISADVNAFMDQFIASLACTRIA